MKSIRKRAVLCPGALYACAVLVLLISGCGGGGDSGGGSARLVTAGANAAPTIGGNPPANVVAGESYSFSPTISDADSDTLFLSVDGLPAWATFSEEDGTISGTPGAGDVGIFSDISISVSDGSMSASLGPFDIEVLAPGSASGTVELSWTPPKTNVDGSELLDLAGYRIYWGRSPGEFPNSVTIDNPTVDRYVIEGLAPGTYEFAATALNEAGLESRFSSVASAQID